MNPRNLTREAIEQSNDIEPYCFETDREEQWFNVGLQYGLDVADSDPISPWISVKDDLPCNHEEMIVVNDGDIKTKSVYIFSDFFGFITNHMEKKGSEWYWFLSLKGSITHWMPIPKLPK